MREHLAGGRRRIHEEGHSKEIQARLIPRPVAAHAAPQSTMAKTAPKLNAEEIQRVIATAWDDRPPYDQVMRAHGIGHGELVALLKRELTPAAYKLWAARGKAAKGATKRSTWPHGR